MPAKKSLKKPTKTKTRVKTTKKTTVSNKKNSSLNSQKKPRLIPAWKLFILAFKAYLPAKKAALILLLFHVLVTVFVISDDIVQSQTQVYLGLVLTIFMSMMYIWILRETTQEKPQLRMPEIVYLAPSQIVPYIFLLSLVTVQVLPFAFGALIFQLAIGAGIAIHFWEQVLFGLLWLILSLPSIYWLSTTLMSLILVTIQGVRPLQAWRAARELVRGYTFQVAWRMLVFIAVYFTLVLGGVLGAVAIGRTVFAIQIPNYSVPVIVPLFVAYAFTLYRNLLSYE